MSMDGKRFGVGIAAGLLLALAIVGSTGSTSGLFATFSPSGQNAVVRSSSSSTTPQSSLTQVTATTSAETTGTYYVYTSSPGGETQTATTFATSASSTISTSVITSASNSTVVPAISGGGDYLMAVLSNLTSNSPEHGSASRLPAIASQPALLNGIVLVPFVVAVILGALLFRAAAKGRSVEAEPTVQ